MTRRTLRFSGILILSLILVVGFCAAAEGTTAASETTPLYPPLPDNIDTDSSLAPYDGPNGPGSALYGFRLALENLDESFTFNQTERVDKQMNHAQLRIREALHELAQNKTQAADEALDLYWQKINQTEAALAPFGTNSNGLLHAQEMIAKHQVVLEQLRLSHPNNTGLERAYANSLQLEYKFQEKTQMKFERLTDGGNRTVMKVVRVEKETRSQKGDGNGWQVMETAQNQTATREQGSQNGKGQAGKNTGDTVTPSGQQDKKPEVTGSPSSQQEKKPDVTVSPSQDRQPSNDNNGQGKKSDAADKSPGNANGKGRGNA